MGGGPRDGPGAAHAPADLGLLVPYAYQRAAQDRLETWVDVNVPDAVRAARTPAEELPYALAEYIAVADALTASFAELPSLLGTTPSDATRARLQADLATMTGHAAAIAQAWKDWAPPLPVSRAAVERVADRATWPAERGGAATTNPAQPRLLEAVRTRAARRLGSGVSRTRLDSGAVPTEVGADGVYTHALEGQDVLETQNAWGGVRVTRNDHLLVDRATDPRFIYRMERRTPSKTVPLLERTETLDMAHVTQPGLTLVEHLRTFLGALLDVTASSPVTDTRRISVAVGGGIPVTGGDGTAVPQALLSPLPVALAPAFDFVPSRDLAPDAGFCHDLAATMTDWLAGAAIDQASAQWVFQVAVYATLTDAGPGSLLLLTMPDVRLALRDVGIVPEAQQRTSSRRVR